MKIIPFVPAEPICMSRVYFANLSVFCFGRKFPRKILPFEISFITLSVLTIFERLFKHNLERKSLSVLGAVVAV